MSLASTIAKFEDWREGQAMPGHAATGLSGKLMGHSYQEGAPAGTSFRDVSCCFI